MSLGHKQGGLEDGQINIMYYLKYINFCVFNFNNLNVSIKKFHEFSET